MKKKYEDESDNKFVLMNVKNPFVFRKPKPKDKKEKPDAFKNAASDKNKK